MGPDIDLRYRLHGTRHALKCAAAEDLSGRRSNGITHATIRHDASRSQSML